MNSNASDRQRQIRALFDQYIEMYASRDERLIGRFSDNFSGYTGSGGFLVKDLGEWQKITHQDFAQVPDPIRIEMLDLVLQDLSSEVVAATALFRIHLPFGGEVLAKEVARLTLIFRLEADTWKIAHSGISIPYHFTQGNEVYPLKSLQERTRALEALVEERTQALHASEALYRQLTEDTRDVHWKTDQRLVITYISPADERLRGFRADEVIGHHVFSMLTAEGAATVRQLLVAKPHTKQLATASAFVTFEAQHRCKDGSLIWGEVLSKPDYNEQGELIGYHGITREITRRKQLEEQVNLLAFHDTLTRLPNRRLLEDRLTQAMSASHRSDHYGALLFLDLDNFKPLNDTHGHGVGDLLLIEVAKRLKTCVREADTVARFGGDEFVVLLSDLDRDKDAAADQAGSIAEKIRQSLSMPYWLEGGIEHCCTASIGATLFKGRDTGEKDLIDAADTAMYQAKEQGRNAIRFCP